MFFPTAGKLNLSISFVNSPFPKHHRCLLTLHIQEKTQVSASRQTDGESYSAVNFTFVPPWLCRIFMCALMSLGFLTCTT